MKNVAPSDFVFVGAVSILILANIITIKEALAEFASEGMLVVAVMYVCAKGLLATGALAHFVQPLLGRPATTARAQIKFFTLVAISSVLIYNTPVVVMWIPIVESWSPLIGVSVQQLFIPLSFSSMFGGFCSTLGSSTNLIVLNKAATTWPEVKSK